MIVEPSSLLEYGYRTPAQKKAPGRVVLSARGVAVQYPGCQCPAMHVDELDLREGERVVLFGPSGGGKTTLLRALEGSVKCTEGTIARHGRCVLVYQDLRLVKERSVLENVCCGALGHGSATEGLWSFSEPVRARATVLLKDMGLAELANEKVGALSGGQRQRVAIARALCAEPAVLLADEPTAALDPENARRVLAILCELQEKYRFALVISSHQASQSAELFDRALLIRSGRLEAIDPAVDAGAFADEVARTANGAACCGDDRGQDRSLKVRSPWMERSKSLAIPILIAILVVWATRGLELTGAAFSNAAEGLTGFLKGILPASRAEFLALPWARLFASLIETIQMAILGTGIGIVLSVPLAVLASRRTGPRGVRLVMRLLLNLVRTIPSIIWALVFVATIGLGPLAGVFALALYSVGYLTKFFYEALEDVDGRPADALRVLGANSIQTFFRAILPAARPALVGSCLFMVEYNIRSATILGVVGAGGIGQDLMYYIEWRQFPAAAAGLALILVVVVLLDGISEWWRRRLVIQRGT